MKPRYSQNRECLKGYTTEAYAQEFRRLSRLRGMSVSEHIRYLVDREIDESNGHRVVQLSLFDKD